MRHQRLLPGIAALVIGGLVGIGGPATPADGQAVDPHVDVTGARARFGSAGRKGKAGDRLKLKMLVSPRFFTDQHDGALHALRVTLDTTDLVNAVPGAEGYRKRKGLRWKYRGNAAGGRVKVAVDSWTGSVKVKVSRARLSALAGSPAVDLPLSVEIGGEVIESTVGFRIVNGRVRRWIGLRDSGGSGPDPDPDPDPVATRDALRTDLARRGLDFFADGSATPGGGFDGTSFRCPSGALAEVIVLEAPPPGGADFFTDTAHVCRDAGMYWVNRTGGFPGADLWLGPFDLP